MRDLLRGDPDVGGAEHLGLVDGAVLAAPFVEFEPGGGGGNIVDSAYEGEVCLGLITRLNGNGRG